MFEAGISTPKVIIKVISLNSSLTRRQLVEANLSDLNSIPWSFFDALRHDSPCAYAYSRQRALARFGRELSLPEIGCTKSHLSVIENFVRNHEAEWLFVLEDDVWIDPDFDYAGLINYIESKNLSYLRLYARWMKAFDLIEFWGERQLIRYRTDPYGTQASLINQKAAKRFLSTISHIYRPPDDQMGMFYINGLEDYAVFPFPIIERAVKSTLASTRDQMKPSPPFYRLINLYYRAWNWLQKNRANLAFKFTHKTLKI